jgi:hypothetical protein
MIELMEIAASGEDGCNVSRTRIGILREVLAKANDFSEMASVPYR